MKGITLLNYNFKGGVGKTTLTGMEGYILASKGKKILLVDFDPQSNLTEMMFETYKKSPKPTTPFAKGLTNLDLTDSVVHLSNKMDIIPGDWNINDWPERVSNIARRKRWQILSHLLLPFKHDYDYILVDTPPTLNDIVKNAIFAADGISVVLQTQKMAYTSSLKTIQELVKYRRNYGAKFTFLGVVLYLFNKAKIDREIIQKAKSTFSGALYDNPIHYQERVKGFTATGIKDRDYWDQRVLGSYSSITNELLNKVRGMIE